MALQVVVSLPDAYSPLRERRGSALPFFKILAIYDQHEKGVHEGSKNTTEHFEKQFQYLDFFENMTILLSAGWRN